MTLKAVVAALTLMIVAAACGGAPARTGDAAPLPQEVVPQPAQQADSPSIEAAAGALPAAETQLPNPGQVALTFNINGGIAGFCDELTLTAAGDYLLNSCQHGQLSGTLPQSDRVSLKSWYENMGEFELFTADNADSADNLTTNLGFAGIGAAEADDAQKQVIFDWVSGLVVQLRPKPTSEPAPADETVALNGLCPDLPRPALMLIDFESPTKVTLADPATAASCEITLRYPPFGRLMTAAANLFYPVADQAAQTVTLWRITPTGEQTPLEFTALTMEEPTPHGFLVSDDGQKIAWSQTVINLETDPPIFTNYLWLANADGSEPVTILDGVANEEVRYALPVHFSTTDNSLFYTLQPDIGGPALSGRFDNLYRVPAGSSQAEELYACNVEENPVCVTGVAQDGSVFTVLDPATDAVQIMRLDGAVIAEIPLPATDYVERTAFNAAGDLAFVAAALTEPASEEELPLPNPGYLTMLKVPYTGQPQQILSDNTVGTLWGWLDAERLVYGTLDGEGNSGTAVVNTAGETTTVSSQFAVGVLR